MTKTERLARLRLKVFDKTACDVCGGSGIDPRARKPRNGCAKCLVKSTVVMVNSSDFEFLLRLAEKNI